MPIVDWTTERDKGVSQMTLVVEEQPVISLPLYIDLVKGLISEANRSDVGAVLFVGPPGKFFFGMNINEIAALKKTRDTRGTTAGVQDMLTDLENAPAALVCAVDGPCFGGGLELALAFHVILATPSSTFGLPEIKLGTIPSFGGTQRLARIVGRNRALKVMLTGEPFSAQAALDWGLLAEVVPRENLIPKSRKLAEGLAALSRPAVNALLRSTLGGLDGSMLKGMALESMLSSRLAGGPDLEEGIQAFFERRPPLFPSVLKKQAMTEEPR